MRRARSAGELSVSTDKCFERGPHCGRHGDVLGDAKANPEPLFDPRGTELQAGRTEGELSQWVLVRLTRGDQRRGRSDLAGAATSALGSRRDGPELAARRKVCALARKERQPGDTLRALDMVREHAERAVLTEVRAAEPPDVRRPCVGVRA